MVSRRFRSIRNGVLFQLFLLVFGFVMIYPVLWMIANSFKETREIFGSASLIPTRIVLENYIRGWRFIGRIRWSVIRSAPTNRSV